MGPRRATFLLLCAALTGSRAAAQSARPVITADDVTTPPGRPVTVGIRTGAALTVGSTDLVLGFDAAGLEAAGATSTLDGFTFAIDNASGTVTTASATGGAGQAVAAGSTLFEVTFRVRAGAAAGCTALTIADGDHTPPDDLAGPTPPVPPVAILYDTRPGSLCVVACGTCDDDDRCTADACDETAGRCLHTEQPPTVPGGVTCSIENLRSIVNASLGPLCQGRCPERLSQRLARVEEQVTTAASGPKGSRCRHALRAATRAARALQHRISRLAARGAFVPAGRGTRLTDEARRLAERSKMLAHTFCTGA